MSDAFVKTLDAAREMGYDIPGAKPRVTAESSGPTVIDAIRALDSVCDGAETKDGAGFSKFDREEKGDLIEKAVSEGHLSPKEEKKAHGFLKKYKKQLKGLGVDYDNIGHINSAIEDEEKESGAASLVKLVIASGAELWHTPKQEFYITFTRDGHEETHPLRTKAAKLWMGSLFYADREKPPSNQAYQDAFNILEGFALFDGPEQEAYVRVGPYEDRIYVDLGDDTWRTIEITKDGWKVIDKSPIRFWRPRTMLPLPEPVKGGNWNDLRNLINAKADRNWILSVAWAVQAFWPFGPYAHHNFNGEQGTGKTLAQIIFKLLLDPSSTPLRRPPRDDRDVIIAATNERLPSFDNLSGMPEQLSDVFCGLSTGVNFGARQLYTDGEEAILGAKAPAMMNGIDTLSNRGDLLDRTIINDLPRIKKEERIREKTILADFEKIRPQLLGLFLDATATGLKRKDEIDDSNLPRMADFSAWVIACEPSLPWKAGEFMQEYLHAIEDALTNVVESDQVARAVYELALEYGQTNTKDAFSGTATELLDLLNIRKHIDPLRPPKGWPRTPNTLSSRLRRVAPALRATSVQIEWCKEDRNNRRMVVSLLETIQETIGDDPQEKIVSKKPGCCDTRDDGDDRDDKTLLSSVELKEKLKEEKEKEESRRVVQKTGSIVSSSPSDPQASTFGETIPKRDRLRSSPVLKPIYCATCGEDLTGKSQITKNGKVYCAKPGCGYPAREEPADPTCCSCGKALPGGRGAAQNGDGSFICSRCLQNN